MGSVSTSVVRHAHCPALIVREAEVRDAKDGPSKYQKELPWRLRRYALVNPDQQNGSPWSRLTEPARVQ